MMLAIFQHYGFEYTNVICEIAFVMKSILLFNGSPHFNNMQTLNSCILQRKLNIICHLEANYGLHYRKNVRLHNVFLLKYRPS